MILRHGFPGGSALHTPPGSWGIAAADPAGVGVPFLQGGPRGEKLRVRLMPAADGDRRAPARRGRRAPAARHARSRGRQTLPPRTGTDSRSGTGIQRGPRLTVSYLWSIEEKCFSRPGRIEYLRTPPRIPRVPLPYPKAAFFRTRTARPRDNRPGRRTGTDRVRPASSWLYPSWTRWCLCLPGLPVLMIKQFRSAAYR